jgi:hypothetical protein
LILTCPDCGTETNVAGYHYPNPDAVTNDKPWLPTCFKCNRKFDPTRKDTTVKKTACLCLVAAICLFFFSAGADAQCRTLSYSYASYTPSYYSSYHNSYYAPYYPSYVTVPYALPVQVVPSFYYDSTSFGAGVTAKTTIEAQTAHDIAIIKATADASRAAVIENGNQQLQTIRSLAFPDQQQPPKLDPKGPPPKAPEPLVVPKGEKISVLDAKCVKCHSGGKNKIDLTNPAILTRSQWDNVWTHVTMYAPGEKEFMPQGGQPLDQSELMQIKLARISGASGGTPGQ